LNLEEHKSEFARRFSETRQKAKNLLDN
jgi:hypothetical protein